MNAVSAGRLLAGCQLALDRLDGLDLSLAGGVGGRSEDAQRFYPEMGTLFLSRIGDLVSATLQRLLA